MWWFAVFYDSLHSIHAGFIDNLSLESIVEAIAQCYVNGGTGFVAFGGSGCQGVRVSGCQGVRVSGDLTHYGSSPLEASPDH